MKYSRTKQQPELFWPRVVVRKLLNISSKECDYSADSDDDNASDSASDINEFDECSRGSQSGSKRGEDAQGDLNFICFFLLLLLFLLSFEFAAGILISGTLSLN